MAPVTTLSLSALSQSSTQSQWPPPTTHTHTCPFLLWFSGLPPWLPCPGEHFFPSNDTLGSSASSSRKAPTPHSCAPLCVHRVACTPLSFCSHLPIFSLLIDTYLLPTTWQLNWRDFSFWCPRHLAQNCIVTVIYVSVFPTGLWTYLLSPWKCWLNEWIKHWISKCLGHVGRTVNLRLRNLGLSPSSPCLPALRPWADDWTFLRLSFSGVQQIEPLCRLHALQIVTVLRNCEWGLATKQESPPAPGRVFLWHGQNSQEAGHLFW